MTEYILGISAFYHDSAAVILANGEIIAAAQEERFSRQKYDSTFPKKAIEYVLKEARVGTDEIDVVAFYDKPFIKFERLLVTYHSIAPKGLKSFLSAIPVWIKQKLFMKKMLKDELKELGLENVSLHFPEHHLSHSASAFFPSPFEEAAILTLDGVGEWATTTIGFGERNNIKIIKELEFPHSIGLFYSAFTYYCGFRVNSGEYKLMGLAPYGNPDRARTKKFIKLIKQELVDIREDGSLLLNMEYFDFATGLKMCNNKKWEDLFGFPRREKDTALTQEYMDLAYAIQNITEEIILKLAHTAKSLTGADNLVLAGGVALNCVVNGKILRENIFKDLWIQPAAGDAGGALGAAYAEWYISRNKDRKVNGERDSMQGSYLGPSFRDREYYHIALKYEAPYKKIGTNENLTEEVANLIKSGNVIGWFQGRMEYGPRALGHRSILGDPRSPAMQRKINRKIKNRESFRPFAPSCLEEDFQKYFDLDRPSPYMLLVASIIEPRRKRLPENYHSLSWQEKLNHIRSDIPAVTHIDFSARIQTVSKQTNSLYWQLIKQFKEQTGYGVIINTSFNVRGEPIVCTPDEAFSCYMRTQMDYLVMGNYLFDKKKMLDLKKDNNWEEKFKLDWI